MKGRCGIRSVSLPIGVRGHLRTLKVAHKASVTILGDGDQNILVIGIEKAHFTLKHGVAGGVLIKWVPVERGLAVNFVKGPGYKGAALFGTCANTGLGITG